MQSFYRPKVDTKIFLTSTSLTSFSQPTCLPVNQPVRTEILPMELPETKDLKNFNETAEDISMHIKRRAGAIDQTSVTLVRRVFKRPVNTSRPKMNASTIRESRPAPANLVSNDD